MKLARSLLKQAAHLLLENNNNYYKFTIIDHNIYNDYLNKCIY